MPTGNPTNYSTPHYLDASVGVKIFTREEGYGTIERIILDQHHFHFWITDFVYYEILGVLKRKWCKKDISQADYHAGVYILNEWIDQELIQIDSDFDIRAHAHSTELRRIVDAYGIDYSDALQVLTVATGQWSHTIAECKTIFITADADLAKAATGEGILTWHYGKTQHPNPTIAQQCSACDD